MTAMTRSPQFKRAPDTSSKVCRLIHKGRSWTPLISADIIQHSHTMPPNPGAGYFFEFRNSAESTRPGAVSIAACLPNRGDDVKPQTAGALPGASRPTTSDPDSVRTSSPVRELVSTLNS